MCRSRRRRFGIRDSFRFPAAVVALLLLASSIESRAQQSTYPNVLQTPQVLGLASTRPLMKIAPPVARIDPRPMMHIPVAVIDDAGRYVKSLDARDFSLSVDGEESPIAIFRPASSAALGILVDISQS